MILFYLGWNQAGKFTKLVATHHQCVLAIAFGQTGNENHGNGIKFFGWYWQRLQQAQWTLVDVLDLLANLTTGHKMFDIDRQLRPPNTRLQCLNGLTYT